jgi:hypothetical protein
MKKKIIKIYQNVEIDCRICHVDFSHFKRTNRKGSRQNASGPTKRLLVIRGET